MSCKLIPRYARYLCSVLAGCCLPPATLADSIWHWLDAQGRAHFSDTAPPAAGARAEQIDYRSQPTAEPASGLRSGERERLRRLEQRSARQQQTAGIERQRIQRSRAEHRSACVDKRSHWRTTRDRKQRKEYSHYLRKNCW